MGQHTWGVKNKKVYKEYIDLCEKLDRHEIDEIYLDDIELYIINNKVDELYENNQTDYHDMFRTSKRNSNGTYTTDTIESRKECLKWLEDNKETIYQMNMNSIEKFWDEYPDGLIYFG